MHKERDCHDQGNNGNFATKTYHYPNSKRIPDDNYVPAR